MKRLACLLAVVLVLAGFAREMRAAVDAVNPKIRMGVCAVMSLIHPVMV